MAAQNGDSTPTAIYSAHTVTGGYGDEKSYENNGEIHYYGEDQVEVEGEESGDEEEEEELGYDYGLVVKSDDEHGDDLSGLPDKEEKFEESENDVDNDKENAEENDDKKKKKKIRDKKSSKKRRRHHEDGEENGEDRSSKKHKKERKHKKQKSSESAPPTRNVKQQIADSSDEEATVQLIRQPQIKQIVDSDSD